MCKHFYSMMMQQEHIQIQVYNILYSTRQVTRATHHV